MSIIYWHRYITNLQGLNDRAVRYKEEYHLNAALHSEKLKLEMDHMEDASKLEEAIQNITLSQKLKEIEQYKAKIKEIQS